MELNSIVVALVAVLIGASACESDGSLTRDGWFSHSQAEDEQTQGGYYGFSWVRSGQLAGMPKPGGREPLEDDLAVLEAEGIDVLFSLTETPTSSEAAAAHGIELIHVPVKDFTAPTQAQLVLFLRETEAAIGSGKSVGVHCLGGHGRTGTFLAAWFIHEGMSADEALAEIRRLRPGSVETSTQEQALQDLEQLLQSARP